MISRVEQGSGAGFGVVVIGRDEGDRLKASLASLAALGAPIVYADSASSDGSVACARAAGATVVELPPEGRPLNAARGRNAGFTELQRIAPGLDYVQFMDGDCLVEPGWAAAAIAFLRDHPRAAVVCGRRREAFPDASFYNRLSDEEWDTPVGQAEACGGDSMMRVEALKGVGLFDSGLMAGEEPELCSRLRAAGWEVWRIDQPMTVHDMAMARLGQWIGRARRSGFGYAQAYRRTGNLYARQLRSAIAWALALPLLTLTAALLSGQPLLLLAVPLLYGAQIARIASRRGIGSSASWRYGALMMLSKFPECLGVIEAWLSDRTRTSAGHGQ